MIVPQACPRPNIDFLAAAAAAAAAATAGSPTFKINRLHNKYIYKCSLSH
jgi:hypothetical protein